MPAVQEIPPGMEFDLPAYLDRIGLDSAPPPTVEGLAQLVRAHRLSIAFENLDILLGRGVDVAPDAIFDKLVRRGRGGYCFEQNALLDQVVAALGMEGRPLLGRVWFRVEGEDDVPPLTHQLELVTIDGDPWIIDAGFGGSLSPPMRLAEGETEVGADGARYRLTRHDRFGWMLERRGPPTSMDAPDEAENAWQRQYSFTTDPVHPVDLEMGNHWTSTRPDVIFTGLMLVSRITDRGFIVLMGNNLRIREPSNISEMEIGSPAELRAVLDTHFNMTVDEEEAERLFSF
ncbi:MAG: arylamine N-acetyltransferase [Sphingobium sp.]